MKHSPDVWAILYSTFEGAPMYRVVASNYGGYLGSDTWKVSSAIKSVTKEHIKKMSGEFDVYTVTTDSGSQYDVYPYNYGMSNYTSSVIHGFQQKVIRDNESFGTKNEFEILEEIRALEILNELQSKQPNS